MSTQSSQHTEDVLKLIIEDDEGALAHYPILHDELHIGRDQENHIQLTQKNISRFHASMMLQNTRNSLLVRDLDSYTGIKLNGQKIVNQCTFRMGDLIQIGDYSIALESNLSSQSSTSKAPIKSNAEPLLPEQCAKLVVVSNNLAGQIYHLNQKEMIVGRENSENDLVVNHRSISRNHAKIIWRNSDFTIIDLRSANGISINGSDFGTATLVNGDIIKMGHVKLRFVAPGDHYVFTAADMDNVVLDQNYSWFMGSAKKVILFIVVLVIALFVSRWWRGQINQTEEPDPSVESELAPINHEAPQTVKPLNQATDIDGDETEKSVKTNHEVIDIDEVHQENSAILSDQGIDIEDLNADTDSNTDSNDTITEVEENLVETDHSNPSQQVKTKDSPQKDIPKDK